MPAAASSNLRFIPVDQSLSEDAPGWGNTDRQGPICWKCKGGGCKICAQSGRIQSNKRRELQPGRITMARKYSGWKPRGPKPVTSLWDSFVAKAENGEKVVEPEHPPSWWPSTGEELCCLTGHWRILQLVGSHRWTTDDLVTAWVASKQLVPGNKVQQYLDLGTGNASVLQMVVWTACSRNIQIQALGIEARNEAVSLARRSLQFNLGFESTIAEVQRGDFRSFEFSQKYDLITGTPPYFRVDFVPGKEGFISSAVIREGGMPTARQSAPARCEFRGGIEAYCLAAAQSLHERGTFVVCENWQNHKRVLDAASNAGLTILQELHVEGRRERGALFVVYTMSLKSCEGSTREVSRLCVREKDGGWTEEYAATVLSDMSIAPAS